VPPLHPTLAALFIILGTSGDFSKIWRTYQGVAKHTYYNPQAKFPEDITHLLPPTGEHWWEDLGKSSPAFSSSFSPCSTAAEAWQGWEVPTASLTVLKVQLILPTQPMESEESRDIEIEEIDDGMDELEDNGYLPVSN
jgi:hypothetical protein